MMIIKCLSGRLRWLIRRYKIFVLIGVAILCFQLFLAIKFLAFSKVTIEEKWQPRKATGKNDIETSANSARRAKDGLLDDEDTHQLVKQKYGIPRKKSNVSQLRLEELDFTPQCDITGKEAVSAIHRAKTQKCKKHIANVTCLSLKGVLYPKELPNFCPTGGFIRGKSLGCFKDEKDYRILSGYYGVFKNDNTPISCIHLCLQSGFPYAGVQYSNECFCGNDEPPSISKIADSSCNMKCSGDAHQTCGGYYTSNVFETGIKKFIPQVPNLEPSSNETVRIVFLLTLNGRALRQVKRLLKIIYNKDHYYYIHVDVRQDYLFRELLQLERQFANIRLTRNRFATIWGGASLLEMLRSCMLELLNFDNWRWDFVLNLSESDYPVKHIGRLTEFLTANRGRNFVKSHGREVQRFIQKQGLDKTFVECDAHMWRVADRKLPWGLQVDGGSDWIALNLEFVRYVASDEPDELIRGLLDVFRFTLLPAESFFHTALRNSKFCNTYFDNNLHVTNWKRKLGCKCQYKHVVDWCGCSPNDFKPEDWPRIQGTETRQLYFARKFEPIISQSILQQLELWILGIEKPFKSKVSINSYWQSVYHHQDLSAADDGLVTLTNAAARSWIKSYNNATCAPIFEKLLEITSYHYKDQYKYTLIKFKASKIIYEIAIKPLNHLSVLKQSPLAGKLESLIVSSDYDQKEQISRNFARVLSPYSDPVLIYEFNPSITSKSYNVTVLWIDPSGKLAEVSGLNLDENNLTGHVKPVLRQPLLPGSWAVKLAHKESLLAEAKFLVTPLEYFGGNPVTNNQVGFIHMGSPGRDYGATYNKFLAKEFDRDILERLSLSNSKRFGLDLQEWIDVLFNKFFTIERFCATKHLDICGKIVPVCYKSSWSSFYPDPKSAMTGLNQTTGMFDIW